MLHRIFFQLLLSYSIFFLKAASSQFLQFLGNLLRSIPGEDGSSSPIHYTNVFSHAELDLPIDWIPVIVDFEIQALAINAHSEFLRSKFWISTSYSVK